MNCIIVVIYTGTIKIQKIIQSIASIIEKIKIQKGRHIIKNPQNLHFLSYLHTIYLVKQFLCFISY
jgi:hypothetical protein